MNTNFSHGYEELRTDFDCLWISMRSRMLGVIETNDLTDKGKLKSTVDIINGEISRLEIDYTQRVNAKLHEISLNRPNINLSVNPSNHHTASGVGAVTGVIGGLAAAGIHVTVPAFIFFTKVSTVGAVVAGAAGTTAGIATGGLALVGAAAIGFVSHAIMKSRERNRIKRDLLNQIDNDTYPKLLNWADSLASNACSYAIFMKGESKELKCLDVTGWNPDNGIKPQIWDFCSQDNQRWFLKRTEDGCYRIISRSSGKCLEVQDKGTDDFVPVQQWDFWNGDNQKWNIEPTKDGKLRIKAKHSGKYLTSSGHHNQDTLFQTPWTDSPNQKWILSVA